MRFRTKVVTREGRVESMDIVANSDIEALSLLEIRGVRPLSLKRLQDVTRPWHQGFDLMVFNQQFHALLDAGQTVVDSLEILGRDDRQEQHRNVFAALINAVSQGRPLSEAMANLPSVFPELYVAMLRASETTGNLRAALVRYMEYQARVVSMRRKLIAAAIYPAILCLVGAVVITFLLFYVVPRFAAIYGDVATQRGATGGLLQWWGRLIGDHPWMVASALAIAALTMLFTLTHAPMRGRVLRSLLGIPWISRRFRVFELARLYRTVAMLLRSGVNVLAALRMTEGTLSAELRDRLRHAQTVIREGNPIAPSFHGRGLTTEVSFRLLVAGESAGNLDEMMERIADFYDRETENIVDYAGRVVEPVLMVIIGAVIGAVVLALYSPIFELANAI